MKTKFIFSFLIAMLMSVAAGVGIASAASLPVLPVVAVLSACSFIPFPQSGITLAGVYQEVWTKEVVKSMTAYLKNTFLQGIKDYSRYVSNVGDEAQAIHLIYLGVRPDVLINNTTYPIPIQDLPSEDIVIALDKYQTKTTPITDDELYALTYDKIATSKDLHAEAMAINQILKSIHALAPGSNTAKMPVLLTTGEDDGTGRKRLIWENILAFKTALDNNGDPDTGRRLVLCTDHLNDLLFSTQTFKDQYYDRATGTIYNQLGFEFYDYSGNPYFNPSTKVKLSFGAIPAATDRRASVYFNMARAAKASGWTKMYWSAANTDPLYQRNLINFRNNFIVLPTYEEARGAIVSDNV